MKYQGNMTQSSLRSKEAKTHLTTATKTFVITDPRTFDGDPYEVAERAVRQAEAVAKLLLQSIDGARLMARNAQMERDLALHGQCDAPAYDESAEGRRFATIKEAIEECERKLKPLAAAVRYNPKER